LSPGQYFVYARSKDGGFVRVGPVIVDRPISGVTLELDGKTGSLAGMIENFVPRDDTEKAKKSHNSIGILMLEDQEGNRVNLGGTLGSPNDRSIVGVEPDGEYKAKFSRDNLPVGTWTVIFQVNNFAPIEKHNVVIEESKTTTLIFKLEPAGDLQVTVLNSDAALDLQAMSYTITASNGLPYRKRITWVDIMTNMLNPPDPTKQNVFLITDFPPDTYTMTLKLPDMKPVHTTFIIESDETTELDVTFEPK
ncbi:MAG: hypothetical protein L6Q71_09040, partial [Planctomycetes bacterium]|nr:hypothetical protein [Planctomycetota bacterium]